MLITDFPTEIFCEFAKNFKPRDYAAFSLVNSSFYDIACDPAFIKEVFKENITNNKRLSRSKIIEYSTGLIWKKKTVKVKNYLYSNSEFSTSNYKHMGTIFLLLFLAFTIPIRIARSYKIISLENIELYGAAISIGLIVILLLSNKAPEQIAHDSGRAYSRLRQRIKASAIKELP